MKRRARGLEALGLVILLVLLGAVLVRALAGDNPINSNLDVMDRIVIGLGSVCVLATIVLLIRGARELIAGRRRR